MQNESVITHFANVGNMIAIQSCIMLIALTSVATSNNESQEVDCRTQF